MGRGRCGCAPRLDRSSAIARSRCLRVSRYHARRSYDEGHVLLTVGQLVEPLTGRRWDSPAVTRGRAELLAVDGDAMPPRDLSAEHPEVARCVTRDRLALHEATDRLMRENRVLPIAAETRNP